MKKITEKAITIKSARGHGFRACELAVRQFRACELAVRQLASGRFPLQELATHRFGLGHAGQAGTVKEVLGDVNLPIVCAGQLIRPGDVIVADDDGVAVVARRDAADVLKACQARADNEERSRARYAAGELSLDVNTMRERLERGLIYTDAPADGGLPGPGGTAGA